MKKNPAAGGYSPICTSTVIHMKNVACGHTAAIIQAGMGCPKTQRRATRANKIATIP